MQGHAGDDAARNDALKRCIWDLRVSAVIYRKETRLLYIPVYTGLVSVPNKPFFDISLCMGWGFGWWYSTYVRVIRKGAVPSMMLGERALPSNHGQQLMKMSSRRPPRGACFDVHLAAADAEVVSLLTRLDVSFSLVALASAGVMQCRVLRCIHTYLGM